MASGAAQQADGVAQAFALGRQVPGAAIVPAVVVAGGAAHVAVAGQTGVAGVIEQLLAQQHIGGQGFCRNGSGGGHNRQLQQTFLGQRCQVVCGHGAIHEVADKQARAIGRHRQALGRPPGVHTEQLALAHRVHHGHVAAGLQRHEHIGTRGVVHRRTGHA